MKKSIAGLSSLLILSPAIAGTQAPTYYYNGTIRTDFQVVSAGGTQVKSASGAGLVLRPMHATDDKCDAIPTDRVSFRLKPGVTLDSLAKTYGLTDIQPVNFSADIFTAQVANNTKDELAGVSTANTLAESGSTHWATPLLLRQRYSRSIPNDPLFGNQWHLLNTGTNTLNGVAGNDLNVTSAWDNYTGTGINIAITDDGLQWSHPDLLPNYRSDIDWDFNYSDDDPTPFDSDYHGTACAGVAAARGNNALGVSGVAPNANLLGLRLIAVADTDQQEADALYWKATEANSANQVHINSNSWGPTDNGLLYEAPGPLTEAALEAGALNGRNGKGIIYLWAAGNGRSSSDNINRDGYANNPYVIAVGASGSTGAYSYYSEPGAAMLINAPSNGVGSDAITTTDNTGTSGTTASDYSSSFGGTSSATPAVAGVVALMLQANANLTYRDVMHILLETATKNNPADASWKTNGAGKLFSHSYGYGRVNAAAAVTSSTTWQNVPALATPLTVSASIPTPISIPDNNATGTTVPLTIASAPEFKCEHVELEINITHTYRGDLNLTLTSPSGMVSQLTTVRNDSTHNIVWKYRSVAHWGENPTGTWVLKVADLAAADTGVINSASLKIMGTQEEVHSSAENWELYD